MVNRLKFFKKGQENHIGQPIDVDKLETVICLESVLGTCYQALAGLVHDQTIRKECQQFERHSERHQEELRKAFALSAENEISIKSKLYKYLLMLSPPYLFLRAVVNLAISLTSYKIDIYRYFSRRNRKHNEVFNSLLQDSIKEMDFLRHESKSYENNPGGIDLKDSLEKVMYYLHCI